MLKGAICFFALFFFLFGCTTKTVHLPPPSPPPETLPDLAVSETNSSKGEVDPTKKPEARTGEKVDEKEPSVHSARELSPEGAHLTPPPVLAGSVRPEAPPLLPDLTVKDLFFNPKNKLAVTIANIGTGPFPMNLGNLKIFLEGQLKESYGLNSFSDRPGLQPNETITFTTSLTFRGRRQVKAYVETSPEIRESNKENNYLEKILEGLPIGPDIAIRDLDITDDFDLFIVLSNAGEVDLRQGVTFRIRVFVNDLEISDFDHFTFDVLKANFGSDYVIYPPHRVGIGGTARVKISISTKLPPDDIFLENKILEKTFIIFPFRMIPQEKREFSFSLPSSYLKGDIQSEKLKVELRWEGGGSSLMLSFIGPEDIKSVRTFSGNSPIKVEFPVHYEEAQKEREWKVFVTNLIEKKVEGDLIIRHP